LYSWRPTGKKLPIVGMPAIPLALFLFCIAGACCINVNQDDGEPDAGTDDGSRAPFLRRDGARQAFNSNSASPASVNTIDGYGNVGWKSAASASASIDVYGEVGEQPATGRKGFTDFFRAKAEERGNASLLSAYRDAVLLDTPVAYFRFNGATAVGASVYDEATKTQPAKVVGTVAVANSLVASDVYGHAFDFGGAGMITVSSSDVINTGTGGFSLRTVELWFVTDTLANSKDQIIFEEGGSIRGIVIWVRRTSTTHATLSFYVYNRDASQVVFGMPASGTTMSCTINQKTKYMVAVVFSGAAGTIRAYYRTTGTLIFSDCGTPISNLPKNAKLRAHDGMIGIGGVSGDTRLSDISIPTSGFFQGTIDEVAIYNAALSSTQLMEHYTASK